MRNILLTAAAALVLAASPALAEPSGAGAIIKGKDKDETFLLMRKFNKALGVKCTFCHTRTAGKFDYKVWTPHKRVALHMHLNYVVKLRKSGGGKVTCNTCHRGKARFLKKVAKGG